MEMFCKNLPRVVLAAFFAFSSVLSAMAADTIASTPYDDGLGGTSSGAYRIPAMAKSTNGVVVALYDCRYNSSGDLPNPIDLAENWSGDNGATWSAPRVAVDVPNTNNYEKACNIGDPCIVYDPSGNRFLAMGITGGGLHTSHLEGESISDVVLYTRGTGESDVWEEWTGGPESNRRSVKQMILDSLAAAEDNETLADENQMRGILQGPGHGIVQRQTVYAADGETVLMPSGAIVFPMQYFPKTSNWANESRVFAVYSTDCGATWKATRLSADDTVAQENSIVELDDGSWLMIAKGHSREIFRTKDFVEWTKEGSLTPSQWVQGSCLRIGEGRDGKSRYAACFATANSRSDVALHFGRDTSLDDGAPRGVEWDIGRQIVHRGGTGGMSYNSLAMLDNGTLGILIEIEGHVYLILEDVSDVLERDEIDAEPPSSVAVWDDDFSPDALTKFAGCTLTDWNKTHGGAVHESGATGVDYSSVTIDRDNAGLMFNASSAMPGVTVLVKYSNLERSPSKSRVLFTSCVESSHAYDRTGIQLKTDGTLVGLWNSQTASNGNADNGTASGSIAGS